MKRFRHWLCGRTPFYSHLDDLVAGPIEQHPTKPIDQIPRATVTGPCMTVWRWRYRRCGRERREFAWVHVS